MKLLLDWAEKGHSGMIKYIVAIKGRKKVGKGIDKSIKAVQEACPGGSYDSILGSLTEEKKEEILGMLEEMSFDLSEDKRNRLKILAQNILDSDHFENTFTYRETIVMAAVTLAGQMAFLLKNLL